MQYKSVKGISGWGQLGILAAFTGLGFILAGVVQLIIGLQLIKSGVGSDQMADEMMKALMKPENVAYARAAQIVGTFFLLFVPAVLYLLVTHGRNPFWLGFNKHISYQQVIIGFFIIVAANIMAQPLADLTQSIISHAPNLDAMARRMETTYNDQVKAMGHLKNIPELIMAIVVIAFFPAMFEEIFFRGAVQNLLVRWWRSPMLAIIVTSLLFSIIHLSIYLFLSRALLGFVLGLMYYQSRNLWVNIFAHFLNNAMALVMMYFGAKDPAFPVWGSLLAAGATYGLFILFKKVSDPHQQKIALKEQELYDQNSLDYNFPEKIN